MSLSAWPRLPHVLIPSSPSPRAANARVPLAAHHRMLQMALNVPPVTA